MGDHGLAIDDLTFSAGTASSLSATVDGSGNLGVADTDGVGKDNTLSISVSSGNLVVADANESFASAPSNWTLAADSHSISIPVGAFNGSITVNGNGGNDVLTVGFTGGDAVPNGGISFDGGIGGTDSLVLGAGTTTSITHAFTNANDGSVTLVGALAGVVSYFGMDPIIDNLIATDRVFSFNGGSETISVTDGTPADGKTMIDSTLGEPVYFVNPTGSIAINAGTLDDSVTITNIDAGLTAALAINGDGGTDAVNLNADMTFAAGMSLAVNAESATTGAGADLTTSGTGVITITADDATLNASSTLVSASIVTFKPQTAARPINLGTETVSFLSLTEPELDRVTAGTLQIGDDSSGTITVSAAIDRTSSTIVNVTTGSGNNIAFSGTGSLNSTGGNVTLTASGGGAITSGSATTDVIAGAGTISLSGGSVGIGANGNPLALSGTDLDTTTSGNGNQFFSASGSLAIDATGLSAGTGTITFASGTFTIGGAGRIDDNSDVSIANGATLDLNGNVETIDGLNGAGTVTNGAASTSATLTVGANADATANFSGVIQDGSVGKVTSLTKTGAGTQTLSSTNTYSGATTVVAGTLALVGATSNNNIANSPTIDVQSGAILNVIGLDNGANLGTLTLANGQTLQGNGTVNGKTVAASGSNVSPGASAGILTSGDVTFNSGSNFNVELNGTSLTPTPEYDQQNVTGVVTINGANLVVAIGGGFIPANGDSFIIINDDFDDLITLTNPFKVGGTVILEGGGFTVGSTRFVSTYVGGTGGNDVVLTVQNNTPPVIDLNGANDTGANFTAAFVEDGPAKNITAADASITDAENTTLANLKLVAGANPDGAAESLTVAGVAVPLNADAAATGTVGGTTFQVAYVASIRTFIITKSSGAGAIVDFQLMLRGITYINSSNTPNTTSRTIDITANDGIADSSVATATVNMTAVNDAPTLTAFAAAVGTTNEDTEVQLTFANLTAQGDEADMDGTVTAFVVQAVSSGTLKIGASAATATAFAANTNDVIDATNSAFWRPASNINGSEAAAFTVKARDNGTPTPVMLSATAVGVTIDVMAVNDAPTLAGDLTAPVFRGGSYTLTTADLSYLDPDDGDAGVSFTVSTLTNGTVKVNGSDATSFTGTQLTEGVVTFVHNGSETTTASFNVSVEDGNEDVSTTLQSTFALAVTLYQRTSLSLPAVINGIAGAPVAVSATLTTFPDGVAIGGQTISFDFGGVIVGQSVTTDASGVATLSATFPSAGSFTATASFLNAAAFYTDHTGAVPPVTETATTSLTIATAATSFTALTVPTTGLVGNSLSVSTTLSRTSAPTGAVAGATVSFALSGPSSATLSGSTNAAGSASVSFSPAARGVHTVNASYSGDAVLAPATSNTPTVTVYQRTSLAFPSVSGIAGAPMTVSAILTTSSGGAAIAGQTVSFDFGGVIAAQSATTNASGVASVNAIFPTAGSFGATVSFLNAADFFTDHAGAIPVVAETATTSLTIANAATSLSSLTAPVVALIGNSLAVNTTLSRTSAPTGAVAGATVSFALSGPGTATQTGTTNASGLASVSFSPSVRGVHTVTANYSGNAILDPATSNSATVTVYQRTSLAFPTVSGIAGAPVTVSATLTTIPGGAPVVGQSISFNFGSAAPTQSAMTDANGVASVSATFYAAGTVGATASFLNAAAFFTDHTGAIPVVVETATTSLSIAHAATSLSALIAPATALVGNSLTVNATLSRTSAPIGPVGGATLSFTLSGPGTTTQTGTTNAAGMAFVSISPSARGVHTVTANYSGDAVLDPATSNSATVTVYQRTSLALPTVSGIAGAPMTLSATLTTVPGGTPVAGQTIIFNFGSAAPAQSATTDANGVASVSATFSSAGTVGATASFLNAAAFFTDHTGAIPVVAETAATSLAIGQAATSFSALAMPATALVGNSVSVSTTLSRTSVPTGAVVGATVSFALSGPSSATLSGTTNAAGTASASFAPSARGVHTVIANYSGDAILGPTTSNSATVTVSQRTSLAFAAASGIAGAPVIVSATLTTFPGGAAIADQTVSFDFGGVVAAQWATTNASGVASVSATFPTAGSFGATASFLNAAGFFTDHTGAIPAIAETTTTSLTIAHAATSLAALSAPSTALVGNTLSVSTALSRTSAPTGAIAGATVSFALTGPGPATQTGTTNSSGLTSVSFTPSARGVHTVTANYGGDSALDQATSNSATVTVYQRTSITFPSVSGVVGAPVNVSATLTTGPDGAPIAGQTITFDFSGAIPPQTATTAANGVATVSAIFPTPGAFTATASFLNAAGFFADHTGSIPVVAETATTSLTMVQANTFLAPLTAPSTALAGDSLSLSTTLSRNSAPTGPIAGAAVTFTMSGTESLTRTATTNSAGLAIVSIPIAARGAHSITANYSGDSNLNGATSTPATVAVYQRTSLALPTVSGICGAPVTLSATLTAIPGGTPLAGQSVLFDFGGVIPAQSATTAVNGVVTTTVTFPNAGTFAATASFLNAAGFFADHTGTVPVIAEVVTTSVTMALASTSLAALTAPSTALVGNPFSASTTLARTSAPMAPVAGVSVTFTLSGPESQTLTGSTSAAGFASTSFSPAVRGVHAVSARFAGNNALERATSNTATATVYQRTSLALLPVSGIAGAPVAVSATLTAVPSGAPLAGQTIAFSFGGAAPVQSAMTGANGVASVAIIFPNSGTFTATAAFLNAADFFVDHTGALPVISEVATSLATIAQISTSTAVTRATGSTPSPYGTSLTFAATVANTSSASPPTGSVQFFDNAIFIGVGAFGASGGNTATWTFTTSTLSAQGPAHAITAKFIGTGPFANSESPVGVTQTVTKASLTVTAVNKSKTYDGMVFAPFTAQVTGFVNGDNAAILMGAAAFAGPATVAVSAGVYTITPMIGTLVEPAGNYAFTTFTNGTLTIDAVPGATVSVMEDSSGNLKVADIAGVDNVFTVRLDDLNIVVEASSQRFGSAPAGWALLPGGTSISRPAASFVGSITIDGGGDSFPSGGDTLRAIGDGIGTTIVYTPDGAISGNGKLEINGGALSGHPLTVFFERFEPVDISMMASATVASPANATNSLALSSGVDAATGTFPAMVVSGSTGTGLKSIEAAHLFNNANVFIDTSATAGAGPDTISVNSAVSLGHNNVNLTLRTSATGIILVNAGLAVVGTLTVVSPTASLNADLSAAAIMGTAMTVNVAANAQLQDGAAIAASAAVVSVSPGTYAENVALTNSITLNVLPGIAMIDGALSGVQGLNKAGEGTLVLTGINTYLGNTSVTRGRLQIANDNQLGDPAGIVTVSTPGALEITGNTTSRRVIILNNNAALQVAAGKTLTLSGAEINGGSLSGPGVIATVGPDPSSFNGARSTNSLTLSADANAGFFNFINGGALNLAATKAFTLNAFTNASGGKLAVNGTATVADFVSNGQIDIAASGAIVNVGSSGLTFGGGSVTTVNRIGPVDNIDDGLIQLGSSDARLAGGLMINNGRVGSSIPGVDLIVGFGSLAKGTGLYGSVLTENGGRLSPGSSPGALSFSSFNVNGGGTFVFEIANATGAAGSRSGWDLVKLAPSVFDPRPTINWAATATSRFNVQIVSVLNCGDFNTAGRADNFDSQRPYAWKLIDASDAAVTASGVFDPGMFAIDASGFKNEVAGTFSIASNDGGRTVFLVYMPTSIASEWPRANTALFAADGSDDSGAATPFRSRGKKQRLWMT